MKGIFQEPTMEMKLGLRWAAKGSQCPLSKQVQGELFSMHCLEGNHEEHEDTVESTHKDS